MSFCRTSIVEFNTEADANACMADYNANFESMFPEAESVMTSKVSPTLYVNNTVFATMEDMEKTGSGARQALLDKYKDGMKLVSTHIGEVTLSKYTPGLIRRKSDRPLAPHHHVNMTINIISRHSKAIQKLVKS